MPEPRHDYSSNANPLGPCPSVLAVIRRADVTRYPDPSYTQLRSKLAAFHHTTPDRIAVGAGSSELIMRLIRCTHGPVQQITPTFSEYSRCARVVKRRVISVRSPSAFLRAQARHRGIGFVCWPNNPTGEVWSLDFIAAAAAAGPLVVDLAYAPLCDSRQASAIESASAEAYRLHSPNKAFGLTGVRGAYVIMPKAHQALVDAAPSWVIGRDAVALLESAVEPHARAWLGRSIPLIVRRRKQLVRSLRDLGLQVRESPATFLLANVNGGARVATLLRRQGLRVRDASSFGLRDWIRLSAQGPAAQKALLKALRSML